ncbi:MAG: hypothetical protein WD048_12425 [Chitinophagales bacterium]
MIPDYLYRGDSDPKGKRGLKYNLHHYQIQSNLITGGDGRMIEKPIIDLIDKHVSKDWVTTHFLSFSTDLNTAFRFGIHCEPNGLEGKLDTFSEIYSNGPEQHWLFAILKIEIPKLNLEPLDKGVYAGKYNPTLLKFRNLDFCKVLLIDVQTYLSQFEGFEESKAKAKRDDEWLVLPANPLEGTNELSGILDGGNFLTYRTFK